MILKAILSNKKHPEYGQATVITDFSNLEQIGRNHYINLNGGCASTEEPENLGSEETACLLISEGDGVVTPGRRPRWRRHIWRRASGTSP